MRTTPSRRLVSFLATPSLLAALALAAGCTTNGGTTTPDDLSVTPPPPDGGPDLTEPPDLRPIPPTFTIHYHRPASDYTGWTVETTAGAVEASAASSGTDGFGATYTVTVKSGAPSLAFSLKNGGNSDGSGALTVDVSGATREAWVIANWPEAITRRLPAIPASKDQVAFYYLRGDAKYDAWGMHLWGDQVTNTSWGAPLSPSGIDPGFGAGFLVDIKPGAAAGNCPPGKVCFIVHQGDSKDPGPDMNVDPKSLGNILFLLTGSADVTNVPRKFGEVGISGVGAHLVAHDTIAWCLKRDQSGCVGDATLTQAELRYSPTADIATKDKDITGGTVIKLTPRLAGLTADQLALAPYLRNATVYDVPQADQAKLADAVKGQMVAVARKADGTPGKATQVNTALYLDEQYAYDGPLGLAFAGKVPTFRLWAPTATAVKLHVFDAAKKEVQGSPVAMSPLAKGLWEYVAPDAGWYGGYYDYEVTVYHPTVGKVQTVTASDPYAANSATNGQLTHILDLADPATKPAGWDALVKPALAAPEDIVVYETHIRDFSAGDPTTPAERRGKYLGFVTDKGQQPSDGLKHLGALASAGLTHVHLLPAFDFATVDEDAANRVDLDQAFSQLCARNPMVPAATCTKFNNMTVRQAMATFAGDSDQQQLLAGYLRQLDSFNWGYDPFHYGAPEGSYASTADGSAKVLEFRQMVKGLSDIGLRVVLDVVYNHTNAAGLAPYSVLDKIVPNYYHRIDTDSGYVYTSSCCANTASEHRMMERLIVDTMVRWARDYKVDAFRFDLMGLHLKSNIVAVQAALARLTLKDDGVDGSAIYVYGEGWDMGEMVKNARGVNAAQINMAGTGVGTFNDRLRDGARGGSPFDGGAKLRSNQGFSSGLYLDPNELSKADDVSKEALLTAVDLIKIGMAGCLSEFKFVNYLGGVVTSGAFGYNGAAAGYTKDPQECINYSAAHDNQDLWDIVQYKLPTGTATADRVRAHDLALDVVLLGQGVPFIHAGDDLLRSKSMDGNSYDSGDWFNYIDWSGQKSAWKTGLPPAGDNMTAWGTIMPVFADGTAAPGPAQVAAAGAHFQEMLKIRKSSPLFRLRTAADIDKRVDFQNGGDLKDKQLPGVIVMTVTDGKCAPGDIDPQRDGVIVFVNPDKVSHSFTVPGATGATLHAVQKASADATVKTATAVGEVLTVPARTTAVFEIPQGSGGNLPCNTH